MDQHCSSRQEYVPLLRSLALTRLTLEVWEQMDIARRFETTELWILNVGDLKILEIPIEWYLSLAYDSDRWPRNSLASYLAEWGRRDFSLSEEESWELAEIMGHYQMMVSRRKPEQVDSGTFSNANYEEWVLSSSVTIFQY